MSKKKHSRHYDLESIYGFDAIYKSFYKCKRGTSRKNSVANFDLNIIEKCTQLSDEMEHGTYKPSKPYEFTINYPKKRDISGIIVKDRVSQRSINDNTLYPTMSNSFIYDNMACQKFKGTTIAKNRLRDFFMKAYRLWSDDFNILQCDIHGYYPNLKHSIVENMFYENLDSWTYEQVISSLHNQYDGDVGYKPGSQMVQIAGISVLDKLDHYIKESLHAKLYIRYMDDFIILHKSKKWLTEIKNSIKEKLNEMQLEFNVSKTKIHDATDGVIFLGFRFRITKHGHVNISVNPKKVKHEYKKLKKMINLVKSGELDINKLYNHFNGIREHFSYGDSFKLINHLDKYFINLWKG